MPNFTVSPSGVSFPKTKVGSTAATKNFTIVNTSGHTVIISGVAYTSGLENDTVTQPNGLGTTSDFTITVTSGSFPVTVANGASQQFDVVYAPKRSSAGWDIRSVIARLINDQNFLVQVGVGGGVIEPGSDVPVSHPIMGLPPIFNISDMDTNRHSKSALELYSGTVAGTTGVNGIRAGARSVEIIVVGMDTATSIDLAISTVTNGGNVLVKSWTGLTYKTVSNLFLGHAENIDLQGLPLYAAVTNVTNPNTVTFKVAALVTS